jgi:hypothetical protein
MTSTEANTMCCSLGMNSVAVETLEENQCITSAFGLFISDNFLAQNWQNFPQKATARLPSQFFWTSASQKGCNLFFKWCSSNVTFDATSINWVPGQPNNLNGVQSCVQMTLAAGNTSLATFNDDPCTYTYNYLCEVCSNSSFIKLWLQIGLIYIKIHPRFDFICVLHTCLAFLQYFFLIISHFYFASFPSLRAIAKV